MTSNKIIVIDLEATCWDNATPEQLSTSEIIEIGICLYANGVISKKQNIYIRPTLSEISEYCTNLTGITPEIVKSRGIRFDFALNRLKKEYPICSAPWCSWGDDKTHLISSCQYFGIEYPFSTHIDLSTIFRVLFGLKKNISVEAALKLLGLQFEGKPHSAGDDAYNAARILQNLSSRIQNPSK